MIVRTQGRRHDKSSRWLMPLRAALALATMLLCGLGGAALAATAPWARAEQAQMRLLASGTGSEPRQGGIEILLEPGWHTYWRNPGEAGVPPEFDFSASENIAEVTVFYPAPERLDDGTSVSLVYKDEVVFPIEVTAADPELPVRLDLQASFGVCREICIPTRARSELTLPPAAEADPLADARLGSYRARVPAAPEPERFDLEEVRAEAGALMIAVRTPESAYIDLFTEPPAGWYLGQPQFVSRLQGVSHFRLPLQGKPGDASVAGQTFRFVAVAGAEAIEKLVTIP